MGGGISMISPYLSRPLRSLREALESGRPPPPQGSDSPDSAESRPTGVPLGGPEAPPAQPEAVNLLVPRSRS